MKKVVKSLPMVILYVIIFALIAVLIMGTVDRLYGHPISETQAFAEAFEWNHKTVNAIGTAARDFIPWNHQPAELYAESGYVFYSDLAERVGNK